MNAFEKFNTWANERRAPYLLDGIRILLGIFLFYKGFVFTQNFEELQALTQGMDLLFLNVTAAHYVSMAHLMGGLMIALGIYVRSMSLLNLPVMIGAVFINYEQFLTMQSHSELGIAIVTLVGLIVFVIYGGGRFSIDELRRRDKKRKMDLESTLGS